jgi:hypothetical protein
LPCEFPNQWRGRNRNQGFHPIFRSDCSPFISCLTDVVALVASPAHLFTLAQLPVANGSKPNRVLRHKSSVVDQVDHPPSTDSKACIVEQRDCLMQSHTHMSHRTKKQATTVQGEGDNEHTYSPSLSRHSTATMPPDQMLAFSGGAAGQDLCQHADNTV